MNCESDLGIAKLVNFGQNHNFSVLKVQSLNVLLSNNSDQGIFLSKLKTDKLGHWWVQNVYLWF